MAEFKGIQMEQKVSLRGCQGSFEESRLGARDGCRRLADVILVAGWATKAVHGGVRWLAGVVENGTRDEQCATQASKRLGRWLRKAKDAGQRTAQR